MAKKKDMRAECKKLGGTYDSEREVCMLPSGKLLLGLGIVIILLIAGMFIVGGITVYTASLFNLTTFTWVGAFMVGLLAFMWVWIYVKAKRMSR